MSLELQFKVNDGGSKQSIAGIGSAISELAARTKLSSGELDRWQSVVKGGVEAGYSLSKSIDIANKTFERGGVPIKAFTAGIKEQISEMKRLENQAKATEGQLSRVGTIVGASAAGLPIPIALQGFVGGLGPAAAGAAGGAAIVASIASVVKEAAKYGQEMQNLSIKTGISIADTQLFARSAQVAGVNVSSLVTQVRTLSKAMAENTDEGRRQKQALKELGLDETVAFQKPEQALAMIYGKIANVRNSFDQERITTTLFGRGGLDALPMASQFGNISARVRGAGAIISDEDIKRAADFKQQLELLGIQWDAAKLKLGSKIVGLINIAVEGEDHKGRSIDQAIPGWLAKAAGIATNNPLIGGAYEAYSRLGPISPMALPGKAPGISDPYAITAGDTARRIQGILGSGEGDSAREKALRRSLKEAESDQSTAVDKQDEAAVQAAHNRVLGLTNEIAALKAVEQEEKKLFDIRQTADLKRFGPVGEIEAKRRDALRPIDEQLRKSGVAGSPEGARLRAARGGIDQAYGKELAEAAFKQSEEYKIASAKFNQYDLTRQSPGIAEGQKLTIESIKEDLKKSLRGFHADDEIRRIGIGTQREGIQRQFSSAQTIAGNSTFNQYDAIASSTNLRIQLAGKLRDIELDSAKQIEDDDERRIANAHALADYKRDVGEAELERQQKLIELDHKRQQEFQDFSKGIFGAITSHDPTTAIRSFFIGKGRDLGSTIFGNAAGSLIGKGGAGAGIFGGLGNLIPGQRDSSGNLTTVGKLFQNTPLEKILGGGKGGNPDLIANNGKLERVGISLDTLDTDIKQFIQTLVNPGANGAPYVDSSANSSIQVPSIFSDASKAFGGASFLSGQTLASPFNNDWFSAPSGTATNPISGADDGGYAGPTIGSATKSSTYNPPNTLGTVFKDAAAVGSIAYGAQSAYKGFGRGTAQGDISGLAGVAATVAGVASLFGPAGAPVAMVAAGIGAGLGLISSLIGDPKQNYAAQQQRDIRAQTYFAPSSLNVMSDTSGRLVDRGAIGLPRGGSPYGALDFQQQLGYWSHYNNVYTQVPGFSSPVYNTPGQPGSQYSNTPGYQFAPPNIPAPVTPPNPPPPVIHIHVSTMDAASFALNGPMIADVIKAQLQKGHSIRKELASLANLKS
jgi:hypothetical protein